MRSGPSPLRLLHPKWWLLHLPVIAACIAMVLLGRWQWSTAGHRHGDLRNYAYAVQWWLFTVFTVVMWVRVMFDFLHPKLAGDEDDGTPAEAAMSVTQPPATQPSTAQPPASQPSPERAAVLSPAGEAEERYVRYTPPADLPDDDDEERSRFNAYLAELHAAHGEAAQRKERS